MTSPRRLLSNAYQRLHAWHRQFVFANAMREVMKNPPNNLRGNSRLVDRLVYGWDNQAWSADRSYLMACIEHAIRSPGPILECGSGLSTLVIGAIAKSQGKQYWVLEHSPDWLAHVRRHLTKFSIDNVEIRLAPIRRYSDFDWYDAPIRDMPDDFDLVICDGPPGDTLGGRSGLVPVMRDSLKDNCLILLDDAQRPQEKDAINRWRMDYGVQTLTDSPKKTYLEVRLPAGSASS